MDSSGTVPSAGQELVSLIEGAENGRIKERGEGETVTLHLTKRLAHDYYYFLRLLVADLSAICVRKCVRMRSWNTYVCVCVCSP